MPPLQWYLGPPGGLIAIGNPVREMERPRVKQSAQHQLLSGNLVVDRWGGLRTYRMRWPAITGDQLSVLEYLYEMPGTMILVDPSRTNLLQANQSHGTDALRATTGFTARTQGTISSSTSFFRTGLRSAAWATGSALGSTGRGYELRTSTTVDASWIPVRPSVSYTISGYLRSTAAVSIQAGFEWYDSAGTIIGSASLGTGTALSTSNFNTRVTHTATSASTAAYAVGLFLNSTTTGAAITVYLDEVQVEQAAAATTWQLGTGVPRVSLLELPSNTGEYPWLTAELIAQEVG